jgi:hypothetical protein
MMLIAVPLAAAYIMFAAGCASPQFMVPAGPPPVCGLMPLGAVDDSKPPLNDDAERRRRIAEALEIQKKKLRPKAAPPVEDEGTFNPEEEERGQLGEERKPVVEPPVKKEEPKPAVERPKRDTSKLKYWSRNINMLFHTEEAYTLKTGQGAYFIGADFMSGHYLNYLAATSAYDFRTHRFGGSFDASYGLVESLKLVFSGPFALSQDVKEYGSAAREYLDYGLADADLGLRLRLLSERKDAWYIPTVTVGGGLSLPIGADGVMIYDTPMGEYYSLHASKEFEDIAVHFFMKNLLIPGAKFGTETVDIYELDYGLGLTLFSDDGLNMLLELFGRQENAGYEIDGRNQTLLFVAPGVEFKLDEKRSAGFSIFRNLSEEGFEYGICAKLQFSF